MAKVIVYTCAYNAEKTIRRTVNSVLAQTHNDWIYYIVDNGSTDRTDAIIHKYVERDSRIIPLANKQNHVWEPGNDWLSIITSHSRDAYFCFLDADDEYKPDFLEKMLAFMEANNIDIAACGNDLIDAKSGRLTGTRALARNLIIEGGGFGEYFANYYRFTRTYWGKLYTVAALTKYDYTRCPDVAYGWDTLFTQEAFRNASRVGILAESLHKYYLSPHSVSYQLDDKRIVSDRILHDMAVNYLKDKAGQVSPRNEEFLLLVYMDALTSTLKVLLNSKLSDAEKLNALGEMFLCEHAKTLAAWEQFGGHFNNTREHTKQRSELFLAAAQWLLSRKEIADEQIGSYCELGEFLCAACENADGWLFFKKLFAQFLLDNGRTDEAREKIDELAELLPEDEDVKGYVSLAGGYAHTGNIDDEGLSSKREEAILPTKKYPNGGDGIEKALRVKQIVMTACPEELENPI
jgi:glycosyltransferase involved in cell wall biosynthesis